MTLLNHRQELRLGMYAINEIQRPQASRLQVGEKDLTEPYAVMCVLCVQPDSKHSVVQTDAVAVVHGAVNSCN